MKKVCPLCHGDGRYCTGGSYKAGYEVTCYLYKGTTLLVDDDLEHSEIYSECHGSVTVLIDFLAVKKEHLCALIVVGQEELNLRHYFN